MQIEDFVKRFNSSSNENNLIRCEGRLKNEPSGILGKNTTLDKFGALFCNIIGSNLSQKLKHIFIRFTSEILNLSWQKFCS